MPVQGNWLWNPLTVPGDTVVQGPSGAALRHRTFNVRGFGAKGDGSSDDTTSLQSAINSAAAVGGRVFFPNGMYKITAALNLPFSTSAGMVLAGEGRHLGTVIRQFTANTPVIQCTAELVHSITLENLTLDYNTQQTSANTAAAAISLNVTGGLGSGFFRWILRGVCIDKAYDGIAWAGSGMVGLWNSSLADCYFTSLAHSALWFASPTAAGWPELDFRNLYISNTAAGSPVPTGPAIRLNGVDAVFTTLGVEGWTNEILYVFGGGRCDVHGLYTENQHFTGVAPQLVYISDDRLRIAGASINGDTTATSYTRMIRADTNSRVKLSQWNINMSNVSGSGTVVLLDSVGTSFDYEDVKSTGAIAAAIPFVPGGIGSGVIRKVTYAGQKVLPPTDVGVTAATWDPASVAAGAQVTTTMTVRGASPGDVVGVGFSTDLQAMQLTGYVSTTDTVTVVLRNGTAAPIDLGSGTLSVEVRRAS